MAKKINKEISKLKTELNKAIFLDKVKDNLLVFKELMEEDENNFQEFQDEVMENIKKINSIEMEMLLTGDLDFEDAILTIHPGAGGTESQDWAEMLLRMYKRWAEISNFSYEIIDYQAGEEAGIKSVSVEIKGQYVYGLLSCEIGIHRLVRISPFNAQGKRQTSFASVFVYPLMEDNLEIEINEKDLRIDTYRSSGKGGQSVNTTDSAVRITHLPTGIVIQCQNERSQLKNKNHALKILKSRLFQLHKEEQNKKNQQIENTKTEIGWGNQIRSYVFHPYQMIKDHRTNFETGNISQIMDGNLDDFIFTYLKFKTNKNLF